MTTLSLHVMVPDSETQRFGEVSIAVQGIPRSLLQHHYSKASVLQHQPL